ncbi:3289_t:CDS:1 [Diversispora eburnea]|uniref:3289_t:CDS:1 n=1 Tax=Diversispora eburnea TaxID=1213867 RepID=A0A9N9A3S8_9GLOM|nr:3289_t:CDS:1 [Diversispora eburnea]
MVEPISISFIIVAAVILAFTTFDNPVICSLPTCIDGDDDNNNTTFQVIMDDESYDTDVEATEYDYLEFMIGIMKKIMIWTIVVIILQGRQFVERIENSFFN